MKKQLVAIIAILAWLLLAPAIAMTNPGVVTLGDFQVTSPQVQATPSAIAPTNLQGLVALTCQAKLFYGGGGTQINVYIQTSIDQGATWFDVANIQFGTASATEIINLSGLTGVTTPTAPSSQALTANTTFNGPLGDRLQAIVVSQGTYTGSTLASVRCVAR